MERPTSVRDDKALFLERAPRLRAYLHLLLGNLHDAEDVLQEVFVKCLGRRPESGEADMDGWLFVACRNEGLNHLRGTRRRRSREESYSAPPAPDPAEEAHRKEAVEKISRCLAKLAAEYRELVYLKVVENLSLSELATLVGLPRSTVALRVQEGLVLLNRCFHGGRA